MNFFEQQDRVRARTGWLLFYFTAAVVLIVAGVNVAVHYLVKMSQELPDGSVPFHIYVLTTLITLGVIAIGSIKGMIDLGNGGESVARKLGCALITSDTKNPDCKRLLNVVEEMSIASGIAVPPVYVFFGPQINAFAAGLSPDKAVIAVSEGALMGLTRDELQAVIAHEFSHIFNGDMKLSVRLMGILGGLLLLGIIGRILFRTKGGRNPLPLLGLVLIILGYGGVFISRLIKAAVSRQRELLADASGVQYTRNTTGLAGALTKIKNGTSYVDHPQAEELSHLFFAKGFKSMMDGLYASHPPIDERLKALGGMAFLQSPAPKKPPSASSASSATAKKTPFSTGAVPVTPMAVTEAVATVTDHDIDAASALLSTIPDELNEQIHSSTGAVYIVYGLLLTGFENTREAQMDILTKKKGSAIAKEVEKARGALQKTGIHLRLPLLGMAISALRSLPDKDRREFLQDVETLVRSDKKVSPFEFASEVILRKNLLPEDSARGGGDLRSDALCLLSYLAYTGASSEAAAAAAFQKGFSELNSSGKKVLFPRDQCGPQSAREALLRLSLAQPQDKQKLVAAFTACVAADGTVGSDEWEILRAICQCLGVPTPMLPPETNLINPNQGRKS